MVQKVKGNVDLTENRDFMESYSGTTLHNGITSLGRTLRINDPNEILLTGTRIERVAKRMEYSFCVPDGHCDRCGDTNPLHFLKKDSLCDKCRAILFEDKVWWRE